MHRARRKPMLPLVLLVWCVACVCGWIPPSPSRSSLGRLASAVSEEAVESEPPPAPNLVRYVSRVAYDGTNYNGWQKQPKRRTVQATVEYAINCTLPKALRTVQKVRVVGAGRTDAGVHARGQVIHFDLPPLEDIGRFQYSANRILPDDVKLWNVSVAPPPQAGNAMRGFGWSALCNSAGKLYTYRFSVRKVPDPMERLYRAHYYDDIDMSVVAELTPMFVGTHDFQNFANRLEHKKRRTPESARFSTIRIIERLDLIDEGSGHYRLDVQLNGALQRMVRNIAGSMLLVAKGDMNREELVRALEGPMYETGKSPIRAAPANGLTLETVYYDDY